MKIKTSISLDMERRIQLKEIAKKEGRSVSQLIEITIAQVFGKNKRNAQKKEEK